MLIENDCKWLYWLLPKTPLVEKACDLGIHLYSERDTSNGMRLPLPLSYLRMICILCQIMRQKVKGSIKESKCWHQISGAVLTST